MGDLKNSNWIHFKGILFLISGCIAVGLLLVDNPTIKSALLIGIAIWCFCRFYYFAFYVIEHYVDDEFRFSGLLDFLKYMLKR